MWHQCFILNFMKLREYILCANKTKIMTSMSEFFARSRKYHNACVCIPLLAKKSQLLWMAAVLLWMAVETDMKEKKLLNKVVILVFFAYKKYSRSFIKLRLYHWCHTDYFNDVLTTFLGLELGCSIDVCERSENSRISFKISYRYFVFRRWMKFLKVWNDMRVSN